MATIEPLQESYLQALCRERRPVTVFLMNGYQLRGHVAAYDGGAVLIQSEGRQNFIFKHAISTISPAAPIPLPGCNTAG